MSQCALSTDSACSFYHLMTFRIAQTSVNGPGQFVWAIVSYGIAALAYTRKVLDRHTDTRQY